MEKVYDVCRVLAYVNVKAGGLRGTKTLEVQVGGLHMWGILR
jgi:hypothetical protein